MGATEGGKENKNKKGEERRTDTGWERTGKGYEGKGAGVPGLWVPCGGKSWVPGFLLPLPFRNLSPPSHF